MTCIRIFLGPRCLWLNIRRFFFYSNSRSPARTIRASDFLWNKVQNRRRRKKRSKFVFSCKSGLKQCWAERSYCTRSALLTYTITECLLARSGFARSGHIYCHLYATILLMPTAYRHTYGTGIRLSWSFEKWRICAPFLHTSFLCWWHVKIIEYTLEKFQV